MSEMVDRVTKAVNAAQRAWWDAEDEPELTLAEVVTRAAIEAMRDPTENMLFVGSNEEAGYSDNDLRISWQLMIDEALK